MQYNAFLVFMIGTVIIYGLMFWMWMEKWVSLKLILGVVTLKFVLTVFITYGLKVKKLLNKKSSDSENEN